MTNGVYQQNSYFTDNGLRWEAIAGTGTGAGLGLYLGNGYGNGNMTSTILGGVAGAGIGAVLTPLLTSLMNWFNGNTVPFTPNPLPTSMPIALPDNQLVTATPMNLVAPNGNNPSQTTSTSSQLLAPIPQAFQQLNHISTALNSLPPANLGHHLITRLHTVRNMAVSANRVAQEDILRNDFNQVLQSWVNLQRYDVLAHDWTQTHQPVIEGYLDQAHDLLGANMPNIQLPNLPMFTGVEVAISDEVAARGLHYYRQQTHNNAATMEDFENSLNQTVNGVTYPGGEGGKMLYIYEHLNNEINDLRPHSQSGNGVDFAAMVPPSYFGQSFGRMYMTNPASIAIASWITGSTTSELTGTTAPISSIEDALATLQDLMVHNNVEHNTAFINRCLYVAHWAQDHLGNNALTGVRRAELEKAENYLNAIKLRISLEHSMENYINHIQTAANSARNQMPALQTQVQTTSTQLNALSTQLGGLSGTLHTQLQNSQLDIENISVIQDGSQVSVPNPSYTPSNNPSVMTGPDGSACIMPGAQSPISVYEQNYRITLIDRAHGNQRITLVVARCQEPGHVGDAYVTHVMDGTFADACGSQGWAAVRDNLRLRMPVRISDVLTPGGQLNMAGDHAARLSGAFRNVINQRPQLQQMNQSLQAVNMRIEAYGQVSHGGQNYHYLTYKNTQTGHSYTLLTQGSGNMVQVKYHFSGTLPTSAPMLAARIVPATHVDSEPEIPNIDGVEALMGHGQQLGSVMNTIRQNLPVPQPIQPPAPPLVENVEFVRVISAGGLGGSAMTGSSFASINLYNMNSQGNLTGNPLTFHQCTGDVITSGMEFRITKGNGQTQLIHANLIGRKVGNNFVVSKIRYWECHGDQYVKRDIDMTGLSFNMAGYGQHPPGGSYSTVNLQQCPPAGSNVTGVINTGNAVRSHIVNAVRGNLINQLSGNVPPLNLNTLAMENTPAQQENPLGMSDEAQAQLAQLSENMALPRLPVSSTSFSSGYLTPSAPICANSNNAPNYAAA